MDKMKKIEESILLLEKWIENNDYKGYDPFDGLSSYMRIFTFENLFLQQVLQQVVRRFPINLRPLLGIKPKDSTKGSGYIAWGCLKRYKATGDEKYKDQALYLLDWLDNNKSYRYNYHSWGNHFHYASRGGTIPIHESTIVWTSLIGNVFIEAYELFKLPRHLEVIRSISQWILSLPREKTLNGTCLSYVKFGMNPIHNSNMLGAAFLLMASKYTGDRVSIDVALEAMKYSCFNQLPDGGWYYGEAEKYHWIDSFHSGYNLDSLRRYCMYSDHELFKDNLQRGFNYFKKYFIERDGFPKYYWNNKYPVDIQCAAQIIDTLTFFSDDDPDVLQNAVDTAIWTINKMQDADGHFYFRRSRMGFATKVPMIHWGQGTMYKALSNLSLKLSMN